jgi:membrane fusion protein, multidrug efflux system
VVLEFWFKPMTSSQRFARVLTVFALAGLIGSLLGCHSESAEGQQQPIVDSGPALRVTLVTAQLHPWPRTVRVQGTMAADEDAVIGAKVAGRVEKVDVDRGTQVKAGDVLVELEMADFDLRVQQAEAALESVRSKLGLRNGDPEEKLNPLRAPPVLQELAVKEEAQLQLERVRQLARSTAAAQEQLQQQEAAFKVAKARYDSAVNSVYEQMSQLGLRRAELALARQQRTDARILAPFAGIVQEKRVAPGSYVMAGQAVVKLVRIDPLRFEATVPEREVRAVNLGEPIVIHLAGHKDPIQAKIDRISPALDKQSLSLLVEADVANPGNRIRAGHFAEADIVADRSAQALALPEPAVFEFAGVEKVWLVEGGKAREQRVQTSRHERGLVEILGGLKAGERVILDATQGRAGNVVAQAE